MTISTVTSSINYVANGSTINWTFPFVADQASDLVVVVTNLSTGTETTINPSQYTVTINPTPTGGLWGIGGNVLYPNFGSPPTPLQVGYTLSIIREVPYEQIITMNNQGAFYPQTAETGLDLLELQLQQIETQVDYSLQFPLVDLVPPQVLPPASLRANGYLGFDNNGQPIITQVSPASSFPSASTRRIAASGTNTYGLALTDSFGGVSVYQAVGAIPSIQLPSTGGPYPVFDGGLQAGSQPITVLPPAGLTILGESNFVLNYNGQSVTFYNDGYQILIG